MCSVDARVSMIENDGEKLEELNDELEDIMEEISKRGQTGPNGADFLHAGIFGNIMFSKPGSQTKIGRAMGILLIP